MRDVRRHLTEAGLSRAGGEVAGTSATAPRGCAPSAVVAGGPRARTGPAGGCAGSGRSRGAGYRWSWPANVEHDFARMEGDGPLEAWEPALIKAANQGRSRGANEPAEDCHRLSVATAEVRERS